LLSIFIMYSTDRYAALQHTLACLRVMPGYEESQKTLVVDGKIDRIPEEWEAVQVPRIENKFCWGRMWDAGVCTAKHEKIIYLDSDRLLPKNYLQKVEKIVEDDVFVFTSKHFNMLSDTPVVTCQKFLNGWIEINDREIAGKIRYEPRFQEPYHGPSKNVMSGSTAFTKKTYFRLGGVDHWYCGHGAYADSDFHMQASVGGCYFADLEIPELHYPHAKLSEDRSELDQHTLYRLGLDNFIYYCKKWNLPMALAENLAVRCGLKKPTRYIDKKVRALPNA